MIEAVANFLLAWKSNSHPRWLTLCGYSGTGKTHCARRVWGWISKTPKFNSPAIAPEYTPRFLLWHDVVARLRQGDSWDWFRDLQRWPFVVIDDMGAERDPSGFAADNLYAVMAMREGRWAMFTSNLGMESISRIDTRIASRLIRNGSQVVEVNAPDFNL